MLIREDEDWSAKGGSRDDERERENGSDGLDELGKKGGGMIELERGKRGISCQRK